MAQERSPAHHGPINQCLYQQEKQVPPPAAGKRNEESKHRRSSRYHVQAISPAISADDPNRARENDDHVDVIEPVSETPRKRQVRVKR